jgi:hypothetical protein
LNAVKCFLQAIKLSQGSRLQDTLRYIWVIHMAK